MDNVGPRLISQNKSFKRPDKKSFERPPLGSIHDGRVKTVKDFGVYVGLKGNWKDGLIKNEKLTNLKIPLKVNDIVKVKIIKHLFDNKFDLDLIDDTKPRSSFEKKEMTQKQLCTSDNLKVNEQHDDFTEKQKLGWNAGDFCRAWYSGDAQEYEAKIEAFGENDPVNGLWATIQFIGYNDRENVWLRDIVESHGEQSRINQLKEIQNYAQEGETNASGSPSSHHKSQCDIDQNTGINLEEAKQKIEALKQQLAVLECYANGSVPLAKAVDIIYEDSDIKPNMRPEKSIETTAAARHMEEESQGFSSHLPNESTSTNDQTTDSKTEESFKIQEFETKRNLEQCIKPSIERLATIEEEQNIDIEEQNVDIGNDDAVIKVGNNNSSPENDVFEKFIEAHAELISDISVLPSSKAIESSTVGGTSSIEGRAIGSLDVHKDELLQKENIRSSIENLLDCSPSDLDKAIGLPLLPSIHEVQKKVIATGRLENNDSEDNLIKISEEMIQDKKESILSETAEESAMLGSAKDDIVKAAFRFVFSKMLSDSINIESLVEDMFSQWSSINV